MKRLLSIDIGICSRCGGSVRFIACIADQDTIDWILAHVRDKDMPTLPLLIPPSRIRFGRFWRRSSCRMKYQMRLTLDGKTKSENAELLRYVGELESKLVELEPAVVAETEYEV